MQVEPSRAKQRFGKSESVKHLRLAVNLLSFLLCLPLFSLAQANLATLSGQVTDAQQLAVAGAEVRVISATNNAVRETQTDSSGRFQIAALYPGNYTVEVHAANFATSSQPVVLEVGQQFNTRYVLKLGMASETVDISAATQMLRTTDSSVGEVIEQQSIKELPLNGRKLIDLVLTVPGAHISHGAQTGTMNPLYWRPGQRSSVSIGGNRPNANYFLLDGATNTDPTFNTLNLSPSPDAVQEFKVETGSYSAELGGAGGGQINIVTRSGGKQIHGTVYDFLRLPSIWCRTISAHRWAVRCTASTPSSS